jgi:uncharacterized protein YwqG
METSEVIRQLKPWIEQHKRLAWKPITQDGDSGLTSSKFAGTPWIAEDDTWPLCNSCQQPLQLFLQLNLAKLPQSLKGKFGEGLLQLFYCIRGNDKGPCDAIDSWEPFSDTASLVRIIQVKGNPLIIDLAQKSQSFPVRSIIGWEEIDDYPNPQEHSQLGLKYNYDWKNNTVNIACEELDLVIENIQDEYLAENISTSQAGDKLRGWPLWIQDTEYPQCPVCNEQMDFVFQIDSEDNLPYMFGDLGTGHITQCPKHKNVVAFGWACS